MSSVYCVVGLTKNDMHVLSEAHEPNEIAIGHTMPVALTNSQYTSSCLRRISTIGAQIDTYVHGHL